MEQICGLKVKGQSHWERKRKIIKPRPRWQTAPPILHISYNTLHKRIGAVLWYLSIYLSVWPVH